MRRAQRLRQQQDFADVYRRGRPFRGDLLIMRACRTDASLTRFGFTASTAVGNAVTRNRVRRRLKEAASRIPVVAGWDIVFNSRKAIAGAGYAQIEEEMRLLLDRAGVLEPPTA